MKSATTGDRRGASERVMVAKEGVRALFRAQDVAFFAYLTIILILLAVFGFGFQRVDAPLHLLAFHLAIGALGLGALILPRIWDSPFSRWLRWWYPILLCTPFFEGLGRMVHILNPGLIDARLIAADEAIFGSVLTPILQSHATPWLTEIFYICYASYYTLIPAVGFPLYLRGGGAYAPFREFILAVSLTFWVCYLHFLITPAGGPIFWPDYPGPVLSPDGGPITAIERWVFKTGTIVGGAFPSSHVAVALVVAIYAMRFGVVPALFVPLFIGLAVSTVFAGYHYGVDVLYGAMVGVFVAATVGWATAKAARRAKASAVPIDSAKHSFGLGDPGRRA